MQDSFLRRAGVLFVLCFILIGSACSRRPRLRVVAQQSTPFLAAAAHQIASSLEKGGFDVEISSGIDANAGLANAIVLNTADPRSAMKAESFDVTTIHANGYTIVRVTGADAKAALWGGLEAADQIVANAGIEDVGAIHGTAFLSARAAQAQLPVGLGGSVDRREWSDYFDGLVHDRFNTLFFKVSAKLDRVMPRIDADQSDASDSRERRDNVALAHTLFQLARERGLNPVLTIEKGAVAGLINNAAAVTTSPALPTATQGTPQPEKSEALNQPRNALPQLVPLLLKTYPELSGLAISDETIFTYAPPERRAGWVAESILAPLASQTDKRTVYIGTTGEWWPGKNEFGAIAPGITINLLAPIRKLNDLPASNDIPVLWTTESSTELLPWQDANAIRDIVKRIGTKTSSGFLEEARERGEGAIHPPVTGVFWFRAFLWGRLGHSPDMAPESISNRFGQEFGGGGGPYVYTAATNANELRNSLTSLAEQSSLAIADSQNNEMSLFHPPSKAGDKDTLVEALAGEGLIFDSASATSGDSKTAFPSTFDSIGKLSELVLSSVEEAERKSAWNFNDNGKLRTKIEKIARSGIAYSGLVRAQNLLVHFALSGKDDLRQQAIRILTDAQKGLASTQSAEISGSIPNVSSQIAGLLGFAKQAHSLQWEKATWDVGVKAAWQPTSPGDTPIPSEWRSVQTSQLPEFGVYGRTPWFTAVNSKLRTAFIPVEPLGAVAVGGYFVAKTSLKAIRSARLVARLISDTPGNIWINKVQPTRLSPTDFPWIDRTSASGQLQTFLYSLPVQPGDIEILIGSGIKQNWPRVLVSYLFAPDQSEIVTLAARDPASKDGLFVNAGTESNPQPSIQLDPVQKPGSGWAIYRFRIRNSGLYRIKLLSQWAGSGHPFTTVSIDGSTANFAAASSATPLAGWRWAALEGVVDLGSGDHALSISGWKSGELLGSIEVRPAW